jgi:hypothetical protein
VPNKPLLTTYILVYATAMLFFKLWEPFTTSGSSIIHDDRWIIALITSVLITGIYLYILKQALLSKSTALITGLIIGSIVVCFFSNLPSSFYWHINISYILKDYFIFPAILKLFVSAVFILVLKKGLYKLQHQTILYYVSSAVLGGVMVIIYVPLLVLTVIVLNLLGIMPFDIAA